MSLLDRLQDPKAWEKFYEYKLSLALPKQFTKRLRTFIDEKSYLPVCEKIAAGEPFALPEKSVISKMSTQKRRTVYTYPDPENTVLKLLTYLLIREYNDLFSAGLYSFRPGRAAKDAVRTILKNADIMNMYAYKVDIHDYFNSVPVHALLPMLRSTLSEDVKLYDFLSGLLLEKRVIDRGMVVTERKGIMAGTPLSSFYANLYLCALDRHFASRGIIYARYSDDIILFGPSEEEIKKYASYIRRFLSEAELEVNPDKEFFYSPGEGFTFLGFSCSESTIDIAPVTLKKLKAKMRRKRDSLYRWYRRCGTEGTGAAKAFIRIFNRKLLECAGDNELSWSNWFFPVINTTAGLHEIDIYAQDCIRFLVSGSHTKSRYNVRYSDLKALGYRSLVNAYYSRNDTKQ